jgi:uncharacterized BrkB/YihY/UPF0761 family membrane protein
MQIGHKDVMLICNSNKIFSILVLLISWDPVIVIISLTCLGKLCIELLVRYYFVLDLSTNNAWNAVSLQQNLLLLLDMHIVSKLFLTIKNHFSKPHIIIVLAKSLLLAIKTTLRIIIYVLHVHITSVHVQFRLCKMDHIVGSLTLV